MLTVSIMGVATTLIGCLPTFQMVGLAAPMLLAVLRLIQVRVRREGLAAEPQSGV